MQCDANVMQSYIVKWQISDLFLRVIGLNRISRMFNVSDFSFSALSANLRLQRRQTASDTSGKYHLY